MAKTYKLKFSAIPAEFKDGFITMNLSLMIDAPSEIQEMPFAKAPEYLAEFSRLLPGPHVAMLSMANRNDRKPAGFDKVANVHKEVA